MFSELQHRLIFAGNEPEKVDLMLRSFTARMPCKEIFSEFHGGMEKRVYFMCNHTDGFEQPCGQEVLIQYLPGCTEDLFHNQPYHATITPILGSFTVEHLKEGEPKKLWIDTGEALVVDPGFIYRLIGVTERCWAHMVIPHAQKPEWFYLEGEERIYVPSPSHDWWKDCKPRGCKND